MKFSIENLKKQGAFVGAPVKKKIKWESNGEEFEAEVFVRKLNYHSTVGEIQSFTKSEDSVSGRISGCICDEHGKTIFTPDMVAGTGAFQKQGPLCDSLTMALLSVIGEVNKLGEEVPGNSRTPKNSGMNLSSTESAEKQ